MTEDRQVKSCAGVHELRFHRFDLTTHRPELESTRDSVPSIPLTRGREGVCRTAGSRLFDGNQRRGHRGKAPNGVQQPAGMEFLAAPLPDVHYIGDPGDRRHHAGIGDGHGSHRRNSPLELQQRGARSTSVESSPGPFIRFLDVSQYHYVKFRIENDEEQYNPFPCRRRPRFADESSLILSCYTLYGEDGKFRDLEAQI